MSVELSGMFRKRHLNVARVLKRQERMFEEKKKNKINI